MKLKIKLKNMLEIDKNKKTVAAYDKNPQYYAEKFDSYGPRFEDIDRALLLNESNSSKVLELGCGNGKDAKYIVSKIGPGNYLGVDASEGLLKIAREKVPHETFQLADMRDLNVTYETYGIILSIFSMVHMKHEEMVKLVDFCYKSLKTGGVLCIVSKYGDYREDRRERFGTEKYHYFYKIEDFEKLIPYKFFMVYKDVQDITPLSTFTIVLRKI